MADIGMAPYAWIKPAWDTTRYIGKNCAGFGHKPDEFDMPAELHEQFVQWCSGYERDCDKEGFNWSAFNQEGMTLARKLKKAISRRFAVVYSKATEDPTCGDDNLTQIA
jgi:hypothetical protein